jgi:hypothetical protein
MPSVCLADALYFVSSGFFLCPSCIAGMPSSEAGFDETTRYKSEQFGRKSAVASGMMEGDRAMQGIFPAPATKHPSPSPAPPQKAKTKGE